MCLLHSDNNIRDEGACALAETLKLNTTLTKLNLLGMSNMDRLLFIAVWQGLTNGKCLLYADNRICYKGTCALAESLTLNPIIAELQLNSMLNLNISSFAAVWQDQLTTYLLAFIQITSLVLL